MPRITALERRRICFKCVKEEYLSSKIVCTGKLARCFYCANKGKTILVQIIGECIETAFEEHYYPTSPEGDYEGDRDGEPVANIIAEAAGISDEAAEDVRKLLEDKHSDFERDKIGDEGPYDEDTLYAERGKNPEAFMSAWDEFERTLKQESRFLSSITERSLRKIFKGLMDLKTHSGNSVIIEAGPEKSLNELHRARVFQSNQALKQALEQPDIHLGPPPSKLASAGRMNAQRISVFYGAITRDAALSEVRPPVGSQVVIARFKIIRPLRLLYVETLRTVTVTGSIFNKQYGVDLERALFLKILSTRISKPILPHDEPFEYLATQVITEFLASEFKLDGLIYHSVQAGEGDNVVLFHHAARVVAHELPKGTKISVSLYAATEDGGEVDYSVHEEVPEKPILEPSRHYPEAFCENLPWKPHDERKPSLEIDAQNLAVLHISGVKFNTKTYPVFRHRSIDQGRSGLF